MFDDAIQLLLNSSLHKDTVQIERCKLVLSRINDLFTAHNETVKDMGNMFTDIIRSYILASTLKHVSWTSDASTPVAIVQYGQNNNTEQSFKILTCNEILKLVKDRISAGSSEGMTSIHTKSGHLICPSFCVHGSQKVNEKMQKKLERRKIRLKQFETVSEAMLLQSEISSNMEDSDIAKWAVNYLYRIETLPSHQNKKQELQAQSKPQNLQQCGARNQQITNPNNKANGNSNQVMQTEDVSKMIIDIHSSMKNSNSMGSPENKSVAPAIITPNNAKPILGHNSVGNPVSNNVLDKMYTKEELIALAKKMANRRRNERRRKKKPLEGMQKSETPSSQPAKQPRMTADTGIIIDDSSKVTQHWRSTSKAVIVQGAHYVCWFDSANSLFCYRKLLPTLNSTLKTRHIPYQAFKVSYFDTAESPIIRIPLEMPTMNDEQKLFMAEMKQTSVANTLPPATNAIPPWNPVYESLYIMKAIGSKPLQEGCNYAGGHDVLSKVDIWKYPLKGFTKLSFQLRTPS